MRFFALGPVGNDPAAKGSRITAMAKIAVIGTGISGLSAAYLLHGHHDITVYEKSDRPGGHSRTVTVRHGNRIISVDTGFIVFNEKELSQLDGACFIALA